MINICANFLSFRTKNIIRAIFHFPARLQELVSNYLYDFLRFMQHSSTLEFLSTKQQLGSWIDADFHKLENTNPERYSIHVNGNYCITFGWDGDNAINVDFEDYH